MTKDYPFKKFNYIVKFDKLGSASFSEISMDKISYDPIEYRSDYAKNTGLIKYDNVTFKYGMLENMDVYAWIAKVDTEAMTPLTLEISLVADDHKTQLAVWRIENAVPVKYAMSDFKGGGNETAIELMEITCDNIERTM